MITRLPCTLGVIVLTLSHPPPATGQTEGPEVITLDVVQQIDRARSYMEALQFEEAIALLEPVLEATRFDPERLKETYLLLIEAHVYQGSLSPSGTKEQQLWYDEAHGLIRECLAVRDLRHTRPEPPERYPTEMLGFFEDVRREMFGTFEIAALEPADAEVIFAGEVLEHRADGTWRQVDVPIGTHMLVVRHPDYQEIAEDVEIAPATVAMRSYELQRKRGFTWYATRIGIPVAVVAGAVVVGVTTSRPKEEPSLEGPPPPPTLR